MDTSYAYKNSDDSAKNQQISMGIDPSIYHSFHEKNLCFVWKRTA